MRWTTVRNEMRHLLGPSFWMTLVLSLAFVACLNLAMYDQVPTGDARHEVAEHGPTATRAFMAEKEGEARGLEPMVSREMESLNPQARELGVVDYPSARELVDSVRGEKQADPSLPDSARGRLVERIVSQPAYSRLADCHDAMDAYLRCNRHTLILAAVNQTGREGGQGSTGGGGAGQGRVILPGTVEGRVDDLAGQCKAGMGLAAPRLLSYTQSNFRVSMYLVPLLAALAITAPRLTRDRVRKVRQTQWTTRTGRLLPGLQVVTLVGAALLMMLMVTAGSFLMWLPKIHGLDGLPVFDGSRLPWFTWSLGGYLAAFISLCLISALTDTLLVIWISMHCRTDTRLVLISVPLVVAISFWSIDRLLVDPYCIGNPLSRFLPIPGIECVVCLGLFVMAGLLCWCSARRIHRQSTIGL